PAGLAYDVTVIFTPSTAPGEPVGGDANGQFAPICADDFNGDSIPDLATAGGIDLAIGDGTFQPVPGFAPVTSGGQPSAIVGGDFNGDGRQDIAVAAVADAGPSYVLIFDGRGDGTFAAPEKLFVAGTPVALAAGAFRGGGRPDLAVVENN